MEISDRTMRNDRDFTPAFPFLWAYDLIVAAFGRERTWRGASLNGNDGCVSRLSLIGRRFPPIGPYRADLSGRW